MKLHRDINVSQKTAWYMLHRLREAWGLSDLGPLLGPVEVDETYVGGVRKRGGPRRLDREQELISGIF